MRSVEKLLVHQEKRKMTYAKNHNDDTLQASICQRHHLRHANAITCNKRLFTDSELLFTDSYRGPSGVGPLLGVLE